MILKILSSISFANADLEQGKSALQSKNYQQAEESLNLCLAKEPNNEECLLSVYCVFAKIFFMLICGVLWQE